MNDSNLSSIESTSERAWLCSDLMQSVFVLRLQSGPPAPNPGVCFCLSYPDAAFYNEQQ